MVRATLCGGRRALILLSVVGLAALLPGLADACEATTHGSWYPNDPARDSSAGLRAALASGDCAGRTLHIPAGTYYFLPTALTAGFDIPANTTIAGDADGQGNPATTLVVGTQADGQGNLESFFRIVDVSGVSIEHIDFEGSRDATGCPKIAYPGYGNAIEVLSRSRTRSVGNLKIQHNRFHDFNGQFWIYVYASDGSGGIGARSAISIAGNVFDATGAGGGSNGGPALGNCAGAVGIGWGVYQIWLQGNRASASGVVSNVSIVGNTFYANHVKGAIGVFGGNLQRIGILGNLIWDGGRDIVETSGSKDLGRYSILVYDHSVAGSGASRPDSVWIVNNRIYDPVSCGIYVASARNVQVSRNVISGQTDPYDVTLPKGAIAVNGLLNPNPLPSGNVFAVASNELTGNRYGIEVAGGTGTISDNRVTAVPGNGTGIRVSLSDPGVGVPTSLAFNNNTITTNVTGSVVTSMVGSGPLPLGDGCTGAAALQPGVLSINGLTQIGWAQGGPARSLSWLDAPRICHYRGFGPDGGEPHLLPSSSLISHITRQADSASAPVTQSVFWPY